VFDTFSPLNTKDTVKAIMQVVEDDDIRAKFNKRGHERIKDLLKG
jgi:hypothetical protein